MTFKSWLQLCYGWLVVGQEEEQEGDDDDVKRMIFKGEKRR